jgi:hypothetical protein
MTSARHRNEPLRVHRAVWMAIAPMLATSAAVVIAVYRSRLADAPRTRTIAITMFVMAFATAAVAGVLGALVTKVAPVK